MPTYKKMYRRTYVILILVGIYVFLDFIRLASFLLSSLSISSLNSHHLNSLLLYSFISFYLTLILNHFIFFYSPSFFSFWLLDVGLFLFGFFAFPILFFLLLLYFDCLLFRLSLILLGFSSFRIRFLGFHQLSFSTVLNRVFIATQSVDKHVSQYSQTRLTSMSSTRSSCWHTCIRDAKFSLCFRAMG